MVWRSCSIRMTSKIHGNWYALCQQENTRTGKTGGAIAASAVEQHERLLEADIRKVAKKKSEEFVEALNALDEVDFAYLELEATDPAVNAANDPFNASQNYQDAAPVGIDARWAWTQLNGEGAGVGFVDLEQGWFLNHEDYASKSPTLLSVIIETVSADMWVTTALPYLEKFLPMTIPLV